MSKGLVHIYTGDGKGKTTAALGLALRAAGRGRKVVWTSFLKDYDSGEFRLDLPFEVFRGTPVTKFYFTMTDEEKRAVQAEHSRRLTRLFERAKDEGFDLLVLDEALGSVAVGALSEQLVLELLDQRPQGLEVVLTGRDPSEAIRQRAGYISEICARKHPYEQGVPAREGIEY